MNEDLRKWFRDKWVRMNTKGDIVGDCARDEGEGKPKCLPLAKARAMDKKDRASAAIRKRREDPVADRAGKGNKPINVATEEYLEEKNVPTNPSLWARAKSLARSKFDVYPSAYANGWAAKWYKGKGGGWKSVQEGTKMKTFKEIIAEGVAVSSDFKLVNTVNAQGKPVTRKVRAHRKTISPEKMTSEEKPDVLASIQKFVGRQYDEEVEVEEGLQQTLRKVVPGYAKRQINKKMDDQKFGKTDVDKDANYYRYKKVLDKANEEVELDEVSTDGYHKAAVKSRQDAALKVMSSMGQDKQAKTKLDARNKGLKRLSDRTSAEMKKANSGPQKPRVEKEPTEAERRGYGQGRYMGDSVELDGELIEGKKPVKSASIRWQEALQRAKKQREEEEARNKENVKRALTPKQTNEAKKEEEDDEEDYSKNHKLDPDSGVEADQHIHVQLKKAIDSTMKPYEVSFKNGKKHSVSSPVAKTIVTAIEKLKPEHRKTVHDELHKSYDSLMAVHKAITGK